MKGKLFDRFIRVAYVAMIALFTLVCASNIITRVRDGRPSFLGFHIGFVLTGSMEPEIPAHSFVLQSTNTSNPQVGDIFFYVNAERRMIVHRIIDITEDGKYIFKGDANTETDQWPVSQKQLIYRVVGHTAHSGKIK